MRFSILLVLAFGFPGGTAHAGSDGPASLDGIAHVAFRVSDVSASREFYSKLGFEQAFEFSDAAGTATSYIKVNDRQYIELYRRNSAAEFLGLTHVCFDTGDIEALRAGYLRHGMQPTAATKARAGNLLFSMRDPEGQLIEYTQYLPGSLHWNARGKVESARRISEHLTGVAVAVKDVGAERAFYAVKLGFTNQGGNRVRVPGNSGEEVALETAGPGWKPRTEFSVPDVARAAEQLRARGLSVQVTGNAAMVVDPDGVVVTFH